MQLDASHIARYLARRLGTDVQMLALEPLAGSAQGGAATDSGGEQLKTYGYGQPLLIRYRADGHERRVVLRTMAANPFGHERRADRAAGMLLSYDTFNDLPEHIRARDVGMVCADGSLTSLGDGQEFFLLTDYADGTLYADDLRELRDGRPPCERDARRARVLAAYLATIHRVRRADTVAYHRHLRDVLGSGEGIMGLTDSYPPAFPLADAAWLAQVEQACVSWRWRLKQNPARLAQIHGDFHPFNVLFDEERFCLLDRSRGGWGEPADDVSCMAINYLFFSLQRAQRLAPPFDSLWQSFWDSYLEQSGDQKLLTVVAPFLVWRALVIASPLWYQVDDAVRRALFRFVDAVLEAPHFEPERVNDYLGAS
jgi:aminoglycoside phosphotransferase (APT) family kinase protein